MNKRAIVVLTAVMAAPLAAALGPSVAGAAECEIGRISDSSYSGSGLVTMTKNGSTVGARIEETFGRVRFITEGSTLHSMQGVVWCVQVPNPFGNPAVGQFFIQNVAGGEVNRNCPAGFVGDHSEAILRESKASCPVGPGPD